MLRTFAILPFLCIISAHAANWPAWRGPTNDGVVPEGKYPSTWSATENIVWKTPLPAGGNSTPIVWGQKVFVTCATESGAKRALMCFDRADGKLLWQTAVSYDTKEPTHEGNPYCSATPVTDGERVVCSFGSAGVAAFALDGKILWHRKDLGPLTHVWGNATSPVLDGGNVIQYCGPGLRAFLIAMDKKTGDTRWKIDLPEAQVSSPDKYMGSWSTPVIHEAAHRELIIGLPTKVVAYDLATQKVLWYCTGLGPLVYAQPLLGKEAVAVFSGYSGPALAVKYGVEGDVTEKNRLWLVTDKKQLPQRVGSGVLLGDYFYMLNDSGVAQCTELMTGKDMWNEKIGGGSTWGSMSAADGKLYVTQQSGQTLVLDASPKFKLISRNGPNEPTRASLAFSDGQIFLRTYKNLYCIAEKR